MAVGRPPICKACPDCGNTAAKTERSDRFLTFSGDRRCLRCRTLYTPPTPWWVAFLFLLIGGLLMVKTVFGVMAAIAPLRNPGGEEHALTVGGWVCLGLVTITGVLSLWQGLRVWREKPVEPPTYTPGSRGE